MSAKSESEEGYIVRRTERRAFLFLAVFLAPALAVAIVGGLGFSIWIVQMLAGPPGPPGP